jgi:hypothetical protein
MKKAVSGMLSALAILASSPTATQAGWHGHFGHGFGGFGVRHFGFGFRPFAYHRHFYRPLGFYGYGYRPYVYSYYRPIPYVRSYYYRPYYYSGGSCGCW